MYLTFLSLLNGTTPERDINGVPKNVVSDDTLLVYKNLAGLHLANVFEKLWLACSTAIIALEWLQ